MIALAAALIGGFLPYIENLYPLQNVVSESDVAAGVVERLDLQGKTCLVKIAKPLKGRPPYVQIRMDLAKGWNPWERDAILRHLVPGAAVVVFDGIRTGQAAPSADKRKALVFVNRFFMKFSGKREERPEKEVWEFEQIEIMLNRKEDVAALPPPGAKVSEAQLPPPFRRSPPPPRAPENPAKVAPGLRFEYYEGAWKEVPDFAALQPALRGVTPQFEPAERRRDRNIAFRFTGFLEVPRDGTYIFSMASPGAHRIFFGKAELSLLVEKHVVDAAIDLKAGRHAISVAFADGGGGGERQGLVGGPDLLELLLPIGVTSPREILHVRPQRIIHLPKEPPRRPTTQRMPLSCHLVRHLPRAPARPLDPRDGVSSRLILHQPFEHRQHLGVFFFPPSYAPPLPAAPALLRLVLPATPECPGRWSWRPVP